MFFLFLRENPAHMVYRTPHIHLNGHGRVLDAVFTKKFVIPDELIIF